VTLILCIESTCDETAAAIVTDALEVKSSVVASQDKLHERFGGVVPEIASRAHVERSRKPASRSPISMPLPWPIARVWRARCSWG
jgi:tRNA A37 threonylcarbamoyltransferase TsaD